MSVLFDLTRGKIYVCVISDVVAVEEHITFKDFCRKDKLVLVCCCETSDSFGVL